VKVLVTGATGFVGRFVLARLIADGHEVRATVHKSAPVPHEGVSWTRIDDLASAEQSVGLLDGIEVVLHLAALAHRSGGSARDADAFIRVNRDGTAALARAAARAGVRRFVFLSSVKACGERSVHAPWRESDSRHPADPYGVSKSQAEDQLAGIASRSALEPVIVRPPLVYGPGVKANFLALMRWIDRGLPVPVPGSGNRRSLVYGRNLADALACCVRHPDAGGRTYFVSDGDDISTAELAVRIGSALGRPARVLPVPVPLLRAAAGMLGRPGMVDRVAGSLTVDISRIRNELGWKPEWPMSRGLEETASWYRSRHPSSRGRNV
jgi:UDP-glucose 4-epimerase